MCVLVTGSTDITEGRMLNGLSNDWTDRGSDVDYEPLTRKMMLENIERDLDIMLGLQSVLKSIVEESDTRHENREREILTEIKKLRQNQGSVLTNVSDAVVPGNTLSLLIHNHSNTSQSSTPQTLVTSTSTLPTSPTQNTSNLTESSLTESPGRMLYVPEKSLYLSRHQGLCERGVMDVYEAVDNFGTTYVRGVSYFKGMRRRRKRCVFVVNTSRIICRVRDSIWNGQNAYFVCNPEDK